jgi:NADH:ubiquinone oxidoreductase subunit E
MAEACCKCGAEEFSRAQMRDLKAVLKKHKGQPGALIPVLQEAQIIFGYLPHEAIKAISLALDKPYSEVAGVIGFYSFFSTVPRGDHVVRVCLGTACYVRGGKKVLDAIRKALAIEVGQTTPDRRFSLDIARCFGACGLAPVIMVDDTVHQRVKATKVNEILDGYRNGKGARRRAKGKGEK